MFLTNRESGDIYPEIDVFAYLFIVMAKSIFLKSSCIVNFQENIKLKEIKSRIFQRPLKLLKGVTFPFTSNIML